MNNAVRSLSASPDIRQSFADLLVDLHKGDCLKLFSRLPDHSIDLLICDLPFGVTRCDWDRKLNIGRFWDEVARVLKPCGAVLMFGTQPFTSELVQSKREWFKYELIWRKSRPTGFQQCWQRVLSDHESILVFSPGVIVGKHRSKRQMTYNPQGIIELLMPRRRKGERRIRQFGGSVLKGTIQKWTNFPRSVLEFASVHKGVHPTQKPVDLLSYLIRTFSNEDDVVCDPTLGSGSTGVASVLAGRHFVGFELDEGWFDISDCRIAEAGRQFVEARKATSTNSAVPPIMVEAAAA
ncbi:site-specific DNA-methyltransferase (adenine-specific) [Sphingomonas kaistensis]|uniref:Methyltransferase n=1 Tax=Sphingomonas kaistensis TaxID=298708 RepID=A0A7X5Y7I2_9SPHN|nr:site-specific DNA-methyltransferase [Sphingomonas kaistensis]NJC06436.1 site-specific DNA-methyltransferase (adenine-specific) [Sphingomonas kaistensis]